MSRKAKPAGERVKNVGISLAPSFAEEIRIAAKAEGYKDLTALVHYLLTQWYQQMQQKWELLDFAREAARERLKRAAVEPPKKRGRPRKGSTGNTKEA